MENVEKSFSKTSINWYPGHMAKTKREISEKLNLIDVVYEVVDARMPLSSKIVDINDLIKDKPRIMVMTKYDLCDKTETDKIIKYYESTGYKVIPVDLMNNNNAGVKKIIDATNEIMVGVNNKRKEKGLMPRAGRVLIVGIPNAGKSTLITLSTALIGSFLNFSAKSGSLLTLSTISVIIFFISIDLAPIALRIPISRVRSLTVAFIILPTPIMPYLILLINKSTFNFFIIY